MVRLVTGERAPVAPRDIDSPLRVLVVQGQEAGPGLDDLDLAAELEALNRARDSLDAAAKALVPPIEARAPGSAEFAGALSETKPTLLWLSGHATEDPPGFLLADGNWLSPRTLAAAVDDAAKTTGVVPLYVVLWACKTGRQERFAAPGAAPPFVQALANVGVSAVLATLGPLADDIAPRSCSCGPRGGGVGPAPRPRRRPRQGSAHGESAGWQRPGRLGLPGRLVRRSASR